MARILVVDDEPDVRELFNITLKMAGHETDTAKHGQEALDRLATESPDLIVLDLMMPHVDGFSFLAHVRGEMSTKPMRVLVATAKVLEDADQARLGDWPVVGVLNKGELDIGQMVLVVSTALSKSPLKAEVEAAAGKAAEPEAESAKKAPEAPSKPAPQPATPPPSTSASQPLATPAPSASTSKHEGSAAAKPAESDDKPAPAEVKPESASIQPQSTSGESSGSPDKPKSTESKDISTKPLREDKDTTQSQAETKDDSKPTAPKIAP